jgi:predicted nucleic acid-binding protein
MRVVLDTNVLLVSIALRSRYRPIFEALLSGQYILVISNDVLTEYEEIMIRKTNITIASNILEAIGNLSNVIKQKIYIK